MLSNQPGLALAEVEDFRLILKLVHQLIDVRDGNPGLAHWRWRDLDHLGAPADVNTQGIWRGDIERLTGKNQPEK